MTPLETVLHHLIAPMVDDLESLSVKEMPSLEEDEVILMIHANNQDIGRLIGRHGSMASAIRHAMSIPARLQEKHITIKFESYD